MDINKLIAAGGKRWTKHNFDRVYFNNFERLINLSNTEDTSKYSSTDHELLSECICKFWYDIKKDEFNSRNIPAHLKKIFIEKIEKYMDEDSIYSVLDTLDDI